MREEGDMTEEPLSYHNPRQCRLQPELFTMSPLLLLLSALFLMEVGLDLSPRQDVSAPRKDLLHVLLSSSPCPLHLYVGK